MKVVDRGGKRLAYPAFHGQFHGSLDSLNLYLTVSEAGFFIPYSDGSLLVLAAAVPI